MFKKKKYYVDLRTWCIVVLFLSLDEWLMFDDDNVTPIKSEDVLRLSGGGKKFSFYSIFFCGLYFVK